MELVSEMNKKSRVEEIPSKKGSPKSENNETVEIALVIIVVLIVATGISTYFIVSRGKPKIGVLNINGSIRGFRYARLANKARKDSSIKAVVLKINSPGGTVTGTFQAESSITRLRNDEKTVVASLQESAASGAYVVASASDYIYAWDQTLTGGLGVIAIWVSYEDYYENRGIDYYIWKTGNQKDMFAPWRKPTDEENAEIQSLVENLTIELYKRIKINRPQTVKYIENNTSDIRDGSTVYGKNAVKLELVDNIGSGDDAIKKAAELENLDEYQRVNLSDYFNI